MVRWSHYGLCWYSAFIFLTDVVAGDFRQCLPIIPKASRPEITAATISNASFWKDVTIMRLTLNMCLLAQARVMSHLEHEYTQNFAKWLLDVGNGDLNDQDNIALPSGMLLAV